MARIPIKRKKSSLDTIEDSASKNESRQKRRSPNNSLAGTNISKFNDKDVPRRRKVRGFLDIAINVKADENVIEDGEKRIKSNKNSNCILKEREKRSNAKGGCALKPKSSCESKSSTGGTLKLLSHSQVDKQLEEIRRMRNNGEDLVDLKRWTKMEGWMRVISEDTLKGIALVANDEVMCGAKPERVKHSDQKFSVSDNVKLSILEEAKANFIGTQILCGTGKTASES